MALLVQAVRVGKNSRAEISCRVTASLRAGRTIEVESRDTVLLNAVDRAAQRLAEAAERALDNLRPRRGDAADLD